VVDYLSGFGLEATLFFVLLYVFNSRVVVIVKYSMGRIAIFTTPPDKPSPEPTLFPLGVEVGVAVLYYFFDSVLHDSVSALGAIFAIGTAALSMKGLCEAFLLRALRR
jgi:hypothetical protein